MPVNYLKGQFAPGEARVIGIKGIYDLFSNAAEIDQTNAEVTNEVLPITRLSLVSMLSIAIGITNLLPIPALDGGQIFFLLIEAITRKRIPAQVANAVNSAFFFLLILLMVFITVRDFVNPIPIP
jgi:regulator of sigma E protease